MLLRAWFAQRLGHTGLEGADTVTQPLFGTYQLLLQLCEIAATSVLQFAPLEEVPQPFGGVEIGSIAGKTLQMEPFGCSGHKP